MSKEANIEVSKVFQFFTVSP